MARREIARELAAEQRIGLVPRELGGRDCPLAAERTLDDGTGAPPQLVSIDAEPRRSRDAVGAEAEP